MAVLVLGRPSVRAGGGVLRPARRMARVLLGMMALRPNRRLPVEWIIDGLWPDHPPASAAANVRSHVAALRRLLPSAAGPGIETLEDGYALVTGRTGVDALWFEHLVREGRHRRGSGEDVDAARLLAEALRLWRGDLMEGVSVPAALQSRAIVLDDLRMCATEELVDVRLALGHQHHLVPVLKGLVVEHPLRERLWHQLLLALVATGRRSEALDAYRQLSLVLDVELGVRPSPATAELLDPIRHTGADG
ncbi:BTAD domain-containing putative transcriptional regulator [Umezawaea endophytica]|uniref:AfsR/SARP family transcriptional regulator n=1 Tax=Umezawaea endophytica TaxID=1654476 RepID=A0A9X2VPG8_9PSEU|nr:AfsR/SARP family transcriptional regulator [Umezawaea endophytica]MCS7480296.1 AfsR/SARP family transcriptional regulator [Umezawaea endophytica]